MLGLSVFGQAPAASSSSVDQRVDAIMSKMSLEQKIDLLGGVDGFFVRGYEQLGWPRLRMADGPMGVRNFGPSTAYPAGIGLAATWDVAMAKRIGENLGRDSRAKGVHFLLGPGVNIYRAPMNGRNFEYFGEDPFLAARTAVNYIQGVQSQGVIATVKHYMGNNSEFDRHNTNTQMDERTAREIYLPVFEASVKEGKVGAIMDSYNFVNGLHMTQNGFFNTDIARKEWGFRGIMMSDWDATYDSIGAANGGLDLEMPFPKFMNKEALLPAIQEAKVSQATIDEKVRRIVRTAIEFGFLDRDQTDINAPRFSEEGRKTALAGALQSMVLLKNDANTLPLKKGTLKSIAVLGPIAYPAVPVGGGSAAVQPFTAVSYLEGLSSYVGPGTKVFYNSGLVSLDDVIERTQFFSSADGSGQPSVNAEYYSNPDFAGTPAKSTKAPRMRFISDDQIDWEQLFAVKKVRRGTSVRFAGYFIPKKSGPHTFLATASGRDGYKVFVDDKVLIEHPESEGQVPASSQMDLQAGKAYAVRFEASIIPSWGTNRVGVGVIATEEMITPEAKKMAGAADLALVFVGFDPSTESEGADRTFQLPAGQDELVQAVAAANKKTVVVLTAGGAADVTKWIDQVPAFLQGWYAGQEAGNALPRILFGEVSPSGRLPITWERRWEDNPVHDSYYINNGEKNIKYNEGVFVGYRGYEKNGVKPLYPFGYGLSYTTFAFKNLSVSPAAPKVGQNVTVSFDVTNTGRVAGAQVAQLYLGNPTATVPRPGKELKGFERVSLKPGETRRVTLTLDPRAMSYFDESSRSWKQDPGKFTVSVGHSSADIDLTGEYTVAQ